jgi:acetyl coenzyme A synthetase (ADP forming)-like protein
MLSRRQRKKRNQKIQTILKNMNKPLDNIFYPKSIAIIGASSKKSTLSYELVNNIINFGFQGKIFPVNPKSDSVHSIKAYKSLTEITDQVDLVIIMVPRDLVLSAIDDCYAKGVNSVVVITAGFKEVGGEGIELEKQLIEKIKKYNIRLIGPNCMGLINTHPNVMLNGTFVLGTPIEGGIGFVSQSGALGAAVLKTVQQYDIGLSQFVSIGNKADISGNTIIEYWKDNPDIKVITVYLESFGNPKKFMEITREITKKKPVIVIKSAKTSAGMKAASSHTGALASTDTVVNAFFEQGGVIRVNTVNELFDIAKAFDRTEIPKGNKIGILTNAGGPAILAVDEAEQCGLLLPELENETVSKLKEFAPQEAALGNPVDILPAANAEMYGKATEIMLKDKNLDSLIIILGPPLMYDTFEIAKSICIAASKVDKTVMLVLMSQDDIIPRMREVAPKHPPIYHFPESAARAIGEMYSHKLWKNVPLGKYHKFDIQKEIVSDILKSQKQNCEYYLDFANVYEILRAYGLPIIDSFVSFNIEKSKEYAKKLGYPVVIKAIGKELIHKTEIGGVMIDIHDDNELESVESNLIHRLKIKGLQDKLEGFLIQPYLRGGIETIMGVFKDSKAGHLVMFGLGGVLVEVLKDVKFKLLPITDVEADLLIKSVQCYKLLNGVRGKPPVDFEFIKENLLRLSQLVEDFPEFIEIDFNPFVVSDKRNECKILDARMKVCTQITNNK